MDSTDTSTIEVSVQNNSSPSNQSNKPPNKVSSLFRKKSKKNKVEEKKASFFQLFRFTTKREKVTLTFAIISAILAGLVTPGSVYFISNISGVFIEYNQLTKIVSIDQANDYLDTQVQKYCLIFVIIGCISFTISYIQHLLFSVVSEKQTLRIRETYYQSAIRQNIGWFDQTSTGDLTTRISSDVSVIQDGIGVKLGYLLQYTATFVGGFILAFIRGPQIALVLLCIFPALGIIGVFLAKVVGKLTKIIQDQYANSGSIANEVFGSMRTVMAFNGQKRELERYDASNAIAGKSEVRKGKNLGFGLGGIFLVIYCSYALGFWYGAKTIRDGLYTPSQVLNAFFALVIGGFSLGGAAPSISAVTSARGASINVFKVIERKSPIDPLDKETGIKNGEIKGDIELKNVGFFYPTRPEVKTLEKFSIKIKSGQNVAFVGESGCGKSTIISLIQRFYDPIEGQVLVDDVDVRDYNVEFLRQNISIVSQEPVLFDTTVFQNVAWGMKDYDTNPPTKSQVIEACKNANIHSFIDSLPEKYDTLVGERGTQLSGGQKQRIAIARALIRDAPILLLDEATSALDTESERMVQDAIDKNIKNKTTITIAHRLSTIKNSDQIYVLGRGKVIENGTHSELLDRKGAYHTLVNAQKLSNVESKQIKRAERTTETTLIKSEKKEEASDVSEKETSIKEKKKRVKIKYLYRILARYRGKIKAYLVGSIGSIIDGILFPLFSIFFSKMLLALGNPIPSEQQKETNFYSLVYLILGIISFFAVVVRTFFFTLGTQKLCYALRHDLFDSMVSQDSEYFDRKLNGAGALTSRLSTDPENIYKFGSEALPMIVYALASLITGLTIAFTRDWRLSLVILAILPLFAFAEGQKSKVLTGRAQQSQTVIEAGAKEAAETISNIRTVASLTRETTFFNSFVQNNANPHKEAIRSAYLSAISYGFSQAFIFFMYSFAFYIGTRFVIEGYTTIEQMLNTIYAVLFAAIALGQGSQFFGFVPKAVVSSFSAFKELETVPKIKIESDLGEIPEDKAGTVLAKDVFFNYPARPEIPILRHTNISATPGQTIALVGASGSGKSTIINLVMRLYDVLGGSVLVEDLDVRSWVLRNLRSSMSLVSQEPILFDYSISENIKYGKPDATDFEVEEAAKAANIHDSLQNLPEGYETRVGSSGSQLSGGQKQRIAIARALINNPKILLLDEATSALDTESEKIVQKALDDASLGRTTIVIAHRLSTIQNSDWIYVFDKGEIVEQGTHNSLADQKGVYYNLAIQQSLSR
ncbi:hypothetical protein BB560_002770 [Smittium megazygosporum]|uniref:Bile salt export pump n=1 Tax=Smittium megazygosporum TaxID=133381 RepID=A0A2T9ZDW0_9FUNG|nr:hypothetical protein BB560_002770 [Smittium megazygosporum]